MSDYHYGEERGINYEPTNAELAKIMGTHAPAIGTVQLIDGKPYRVTSVHPGSPESGYAYHVNVEPVSDASSSPPRCYVALAIRDYAPPRPIIPGITDAPLGANR